MSLLVWGRVVGELVPHDGKCELPWSLFCGTNGGRKIYIVSCHSCHIYGNWASRSEALKSSIVVAMQAKKVWLFLKRSGISDYLILLYWNFIASHTRYCKRFCRMLLFTILFLFFIFCIYWDWQGRKGNLKCLKVDEINTEI